MYLITTATQEFTIPDLILNRIINSYYLDGYEVLDDDKDELYFEDESGNSPLMTYKKIEG